MLLRDKLCLMLSSTTIARWKARFVTIFNGRGRCSASSNCADGFLQRNIAGLAACEVADAERKPAARKADDARYAEEVAQREQYQRPDGVVIDGATHVEAAIGAGEDKLRWTASGRQQCLPGSTAHA